jgi:5'-nucleotidase
MPARLHRLRILLTNDDGILSPGLLAMRARLMEIAEVTVVAPDTQRSGVSHAVTLGSALYAEEVVHRGERIGTSITGYPADCVKYALTEVMAERPDLIVSGINLGPNVGVSVFYSGTVAAAMEGAFFGIPSIAISTDVNGDDTDCLPLAEMARSIIARLKGMAAFCPNLVLNVNFPALDPKAFKGLRITRQGTANFQDRFERRDDGEGRSGLWLVGEPGTHDGDSLDIDVNALKAGYISVTPLKQDLTHHELLAQFRSLPPMTGK